MSHKFKLVLLVVGFFVFVPFSASAQVLINEIMYDSDGSDIDWIEVYNDTEEAINLTSYKLLISNSTSNHSIKEYSNGTELKSGEYAVIVVNSQISAYLDYFGNLGKIFTASFSLPNVTEDQIATVQINKGDKTSPIDSVSYEMILGANGDGNSLQLLEGDWKSSSPTPNEKNSFVEGSANQDDDTDGNPKSESKDISTEKKKPIVKAKIFTKAVTFAGEPTNFLGAVTENSKVSTYKGSYHWNLGDGAENLEYKYPRDFKHIYYYPGEYAVLLDYFPNVFTDKPDYSERMIVKVLPIEVTIAEAGARDSILVDKLTGTVKDFGVKIFNNSIEEIDISGWQLVANQKAFIFPKSTMLLSKKSITISSRLTGFTLSNNTEIMLYSSTGDFVAKL